MARRLRHITDVRRGSARAALALLFCGVGCNGETSADGVPECTDVALDVEGCSLLFQPTFDNVFDQVLKPTCGKEGGACHGDSEALGAMNGLVFEEIDGAYDNLIDGGYVTPGDPICSELVVRLESRRS